MGRELQMLMESGAVLEGHFVLNSGRHAGRYVNKTAGFVPTTHARHYARMIGQRFDHVEAVVGPELGAIMLAAHVAAYLIDTRPREEVYEVMATKVPDTLPQEFEIGRDQARFIFRKRVLVVEDILTRGINARATVNAVRKAGGWVIGVGALWNRGGVTAEAVGVSELHAAIDESIEDYDERDCPLCRARIPIDTRVGKGRDFLAQQAREHG